MATLVPLVPAYVDASLDKTPHAQAATAAAKQCAHHLGHALGKEWQACVVDALLDAKRTALEAGHERYFDLPQHSYEPLTPLSRAPMGQLFRNLLRNFTCDFDDGGTPPLRSQTWEYETPDPCAAYGKGPPPPAFLAKPGFLPGGDDIQELQGMYTEKDARAACLKEPRCKAITFHSETRSPSSRSLFYFKDRLGAISEGAHWHTLKRLPSMAEVCGEGGYTPPPPLRLRVDVLRVSPPVYLVHDFLTDEECDHLVGESIPKMERSVVFSGKDDGAVSSYRSSYSMNMVPDFDDETNVVTKIVRRKFAFAREVADYEELFEGEGQEPLNAVYYKDYDDQYRPHCDGECHGGRYKRGRRIATSLSYCRVADKGGFTTFDRAGLKVVPRRGQMLFFGYKHNGPPPTMDDGLTEHSGCPLREGEKWIATMWFREGMTADKGWKSFPT